MARSRRTQSERGRAKGGSRSTGRRRKPKMAETADRHALYQQAVQSPEADVEFFTQAFRELRGRMPKSLREDFCGTAYLATTWAASKRGRTAIGVDLDAPTLEWGRAHNVEPAGRSVARRVELLCADVLDVETPAVDVICAMNFSFCVFHDRATLRRYFENARRALVDDGILVLEIYGGTEAIEAREESRPCDGFTYVWDQDRFDPIHNRTLCYIHFRFPDRSKMERAFVYDWRLWSIPELREVLEEAGFTSSVVYWEEVDDDGDGTGEFRRTESEEQQESFLAYVIGLK
ncbi:MAG: class I SAM-dependent methyltransferase [Deltaproteobacteria bacterium]|nr:MAG: class I SAM-dependent methyltransferase [Deltaproteobacteria bacterium]